MGYTARFEEVCGVVVDRIREVMERRNLEVISTFDLEDARESCNHCACPHHRDENCDYVILLARVVGCEHGPSRLISVHGHDDHTWVKLLSDEVVPGELKDLYRDFDTVLADALAEVTADARAIG